MQPNEQNKMKNNEKLLETRLNKKRKEMKNWFEAKVGWWGKIKNLSAGD